jgi:hypothetical protein
MVITGLSPPCETYCPGATSRDATTPLIGATSVVMS